MVFRDVEEELRARIAAKEAVTFAEFAEVALYWPHGGYYPSRSPVGARGDFYTAPTAHPLFGALLAHQLEQQWRLMGMPHRFWVAELGAGNGRLAGDILAHAQHLDPAFARAVQYVPVDLYAPAEAGTDGAHWVRAAAPPFRGLRGCVLANELLDAMPVHRVTVREGRLRELYVTLDGEGTFTEKMGAPSTPALARRLDDLGIRLPEGYRTEVCLGLERWVREVAEGLDQGYVMVIDYGHEAASLYDESRSSGILRCYYRHTLNANPYQHVGRQDISVHVDFTTLQRLARRYGLEVAGYASQAQFLANLGLPRYREVIARRDGLSAEVRRANLRAIDTLVEPGGMGDFKALVLSKGVTSAPLHGFTPRNPLLQSLQRRETEPRAPLATTGHMPLAGASRPMSSLPTWEELMR